MSLQMIPLEDVRTSLAYLRSKVPPRYFHLKQLPIRVVCSAQEAGCFEVVDGFKRLKAIEDSDVKEIGVVVEDVQGAQAKALLLHANAQERTLTPMDEGRVVVSLVDEDGLTITQTARLLHRKRPWASKR